MRSLSNILWLVWKELLSLWRELMLLLLVVYSFGPGLYIESAGAGDAIRNTPVTFVDEDDSPLSRALRTALYKPMFLDPATVAAAEVDRLLDWGETAFVVTVPKGFEADLRAGRRVALQIAVDATRSMQATLGTGYLTAILSQEVGRHLARTDAGPAAPFDLVIRRAYNPTGNQVWFSALAGLLDHLSMLAIVLTGAALIREREHGTLEHLMVLPLASYQIALSKILANGGIVFLAFAFGLFVVVQKALEVPFAGSEALLLVGTAIYLFAAAAIGLLLGILARSMAQFALLLLLVIMPMMILSGGMTPTESQPLWLRPITFLLPSRHYMDFATSIAYRGADLSVVWPEFLATFLLGAGVLAASLLLFRRSVAGG